MEAPAWVWPWCERWPEPALTLVIAGRRPGPIDDAASEVKALGRDALALPTDVSDSCQVGRMVATTLQHFGQIDVLINNAALVSQNVRKPIWDISDDEWQGAMNVNLNGAFYCSRAVAKPMADRGQGKIVNVASGFGLRGGRDIYMYCCSKGAIIQLTRVLSFSLARHGITGQHYCSRVHPHQEHRRGPSRHPAAFGRLSTDREARRAGGPGTGGGIPVLGSLRLHDRRDDHRRWWRVGRRSGADRSRAPGAARGRLTWKSTPEGTENIDMPEVKESNQVTGSIISAATEVHRTLGPGLPESAYEACLAYSRSYQEPPPPRPSPRGRGS